MENSGVSNVPGYFLGGIALIVILFVCSYQLDKVWKWLQLHRFGVTTQGTIVELATTSGSFWENWKNKYYVVFRFEVPSSNSSTRTIYQERRLSEWLYNQLKTGQRVPVRYLPTHPELSELLVKSKIDKLHRVCKVIFIIALLNFGLFFVSFMLLGGDALNSKVEAGHYFLNSHGRYTEVNYWVFMYSKLHGVSLFITHPLAIVAGLIYWVTGGER